ncbi:MAG: hypothetical protein QXT69_02275 [Fervidicoccaceae archaeon]
MSQETASEKEFEEIIEKLKSNTELLISTVELLLYLYKKQMEGRDEIPHIGDRISSAFNSIELAAYDSNISQNLIKDIEAWKTIEVDVEGKKRSILLFLVDFNILSIKEVERVIVCPICSSPRVRVVLLCPYCGSTNVEPSEIVQHFLCGYAGPKSSFFFGEKMICPNCKQNVTERDLKKLGKSFYCESCRRIFRSPSVKLMCLNYLTTLHQKNYQFELVDSKIRKLYGYILTKKGEDLIFDGRMLLEALSALLPPASGINILRGAEAKEFIERKYNLRDVEFSAIAVRNEKVAAIDILGKDPLPSILKSGITSSLKIPYLVIAHPESLRSLTSVEKAYSNVRIRSIISADLNDLKNEILSMLS